MANECNIMDMFVGDLLPQIYCKKVTLENHPDDPEKKSKVTLLLEMYEERDKLNNAGWLTNINIPGGTNILDSLYINYHVITDSTNLEKLKPNTDPEFNSTGNLYVLKQNKPDWKYIQGLHSKLCKFCTAKIQVAASSLLGDFKKGDVLSGLGGKMREEYKNGKWYYIIPFKLLLPWEFDFTPQNMGIILYSYLDMATLFPEKVNDPYVQSLSLEGPVNTEIIFDGGNLATTRQAFIAPGGLLWEGAIHYHGDSNPAPDGYKGWMAGDRHRGGTDQLKLQLLEVPNTKITDFRDSSIIMPNSQEDNVLGMGKDSIIGVGPNYEKAEAIIGGILSPFQKEKKKDFIIDNDDEYSKLYLSRDRKNNAHGMFFINFKNLLQNNSSLYPILGKKYQQYGVSTEAETLQEILQESKILELRVYRDRVRPVNLRQPYKKFSDGEMFEEPSRLIGTISDINNYKTPRENYEAGKTYIKEISLSSKVESYMNRYFVFSDYEVGSYDAGLYQYRVELDFVDGTKVFINKLMDELRQIKLEMEQYYEFAISGRKTNLDFSYKMSYSSESGTKVHFKPYYDDTYKSFNDEFLVDATYNFATKLNIVPIWQRAAEWIIKTYLYFIEQEAHGLSILSWGLNLANMISPTSGTPEGINFCIRLIDSIVTKIDSIIGSTKTSSNNNLNDKSSVDDQSYLPVHAYESKVNTNNSVIYEKHSFDNAGEVFDATIHEGIYADFLSVGTEIPLVFKGLRGVTPEYYKNRVLLESAKFFSTGKSMESLYETYTPPFATNTQDSIIKNAFGYLTPSEVKISDSAKINKTFNFVQKSFSNAAYTALEPGNLTKFSLLSKTFLNHNNYNSLMVSLINYGLDKESDRNVDVVAPPFALSGDASDSEKTYFQLDSAYRKLFEELNVTLHDVNKHDSFFNPRRPKSEDPKIPVHPLKREFFSEALGLSTFYFRDCLSNENQKIISFPPGTTQPYPYSEKLPNSFKSRQMFNIGLTDRISSEMKEIFNKPEEDHYDAFRFFNFNMTAIVEVFSGTASHPSDDLWETLNADHVLSLGDFDVLFCRLKYYDIKLLGKLDMPIIDEYFLIFKGAVSIPQPSLPVQMISIKDVVEKSNKVGTSFMNQQANAKLNEVAATLAKGVLPTSNLSVTPTSTAAQNTSGDINKAPAKTGQAGPQNIDY